MSKSQRIINGVSNVLGGVTNAIYSGMQLAQNKDTSGLESQMYDIQESPVYTDDYDGNHADSMIHLSKANGLTCVGVSSYKVTF